MTAIERIEAGLASLARAATAAKALAPAVAEAADRYASVFRAGGRVFFAGNGGSAADAQHLATEYVVRFRTLRAPLGAIALTTDSSLLTAAANDLGFEQVFARQVAALARRGDLLVLHSTSGASRNLLAAAETARAAGVGVVAFLGAGGGPLAALADLVIRAPAEETSRIQELHLALEHLIVELVEEALAS